MLRVTLACLATTTTLLISTAHAHVGAFRIDLSVAVSAADHGTRWW